LALLVGLQEGQQMWWTCSACLLISPVYSIISPMLSLTAVVTVIPFTYLWSAIAMPAVFIAEGVNDQSGVCLSVLMHDRCATVHQEVISLL